MLKLAIASDLHLEFGDLVLENTDDADVLVLAGDICLARDLDKQNKSGDRARGFFQRVSDEFARVIYVTGNHEVYNGDFAWVHTQIRDFLKAHHITNITLLDKESVVIGGHDIHGGTLWTDFNGQDPATMRCAEWSMNDYRGVKNSHDAVSRKFLPKHALQDHIQMVGYLQDRLDDQSDSGRGDQGVVVVTHHGPSKNSIHQRYAHDDLMNGNYVSSLDQFILDRPQIKLWIHGHTHTPFDYEIGSCRVVCNPRGYVGYEPQANSFRLKYVEI